MIYILQASKNIKIGITNDLEQRIKSLQTGNPERIRVVKTYVLKPEYNDAHLERRIHHALRRKRSHGEWFLCEPLDLYLEAIDQILCDYLA